jgi:hypothetical protein
MKIMAFVNQASHIKSTLEHLGLATEAPKAQKALGLAQYELWPFPN